MGFNSYSSSTTLFISLKLLLFTNAISSDCGTYCYTPTNPTPIYPNPHATPSSVVHTPTKVTKPTPKPRPTPSPAKCPRDTLKIGVCANLHGGLLGAVIGHPPSHPCYTLIDGLVDTQAAVCLCTALKVNVTGVKLDINIALNTLINTCGKKIPPGYRCT